MVNRKRDLIIGCVAVGYGNPAVDPGRAVETVDVKQSFIAIAHGRIEIGERQLERLSKDQIIDDAAALFGNDVEAKIKRQET